MPVDIFEKERLFLLGKYQPCLQERRLMGLVA